MVLARHLVGHVLPRITVLYLRYASMRGWGFGRFIDGVPLNAVQHQMCFACQEARAVKDRDFAFTRSAP